MNRNLSALERSIICKSAVLLDVHHGFREIGSEFNVACNVSSLGCCISFCSCVVVNLKGYSLVTIISPPEPQVNYLICQIVAKFVYKSTGYFIQVTHVVDGSGSDQRSIGTLLEVHHLLVHNSDI